MMLIRLGNGDGGEQSLARVGSFYTVNNDCGPRSRMYIVDERAELDNRHCGGTVWLVRDTAIRLHIITLLYSEAGAEGDITGSGQSIGRAHGSTSTCPTSGQ